MKHTPQTKAQIASLRNWGEAALSHWKIILKEAQEFRGPKQVENARRQIEWLNGYLQALNDVAGDK